MWDLASQVGTPTFVWRLYLPLGVIPLDIFSQGQEGILSFERQMCVKDWTGIQKEDNVV